MTEQTFVPGEVVAPADPRIVLEGQWGLQPGLAVTVNSGSRISFAFTGTVVQALFDVDGLDTPPHLWISVDGAVPELHLLEKPVVELTGDQGQHKVEIVVKDVNEFANRWNPPFGCAVQFAGLVLDQDTRLRLGARPSGPRLEFYGDSITQGVRCLSADPQSAGADGTRSYAYLTARALGATACQVGFGSQGIVRPGNGEVPGGLESFGWNYAGSPSERVQEPEVVVNNLGVNDETLTAAEYGSYLALLRGAYPSATIIALSPFNGTHAEVIEEAVLAAGNSAIVYVSTAGWITEADTTDGIHPSVEGHVKLADRLVEALAEHTDLRPRT